MLIRIALLVLLGALVPGADAQFGVPLNCIVAEHNGDCDLYAISMVQLLATPERFDGKRIRVVGYIHFESEANAIYLHKEDQEHRLVKNGVWASFAEGMSFDGCQDAYVPIEGIYRARNEGRMSAWSGAITRITRCQKMP